MKNLTEGDTTSRKGKASWRRWHIDSHLEVGAKSTCAEKDGGKRCEGDPSSRGEEPLKVYG